MLFVITGNGKGKTTSSLGMIERMLGNGGKCLVLQFIKTNPQAYGEYKSLTSQGVEWQSFGEGFTYRLDSTEKTKELCRKGFNEFCRAALSGVYSMIVLDEFTYAMNYGFVEERDFLEFLTENKNKEGFPHVVVTGRDASDILVKNADTVSEIREIKHHWNSNGHKTVNGIEF